MAKVKSQLSSDGAKLIRHHKPYGVLDGIFSDRWRPKESSPY